MQKLRHPEKVNKEFNPIKKSLLGFELKLTTLVFLLKQKKS